jgi:serine/threonine-protein kinase
MLGCGLLGTAEYMSPEQARGASIDHRSDIYSYGVLLYKMATGKVPFDSDNLLGILEAHRTEVPMPIRDLIPLPQEVPPLLEDIILKCLSKSPTERYQSMEEVIADLDKLETEIAPKALVLRKPRALQIPKVMPELLPPIVRVPPAPKAAEPEGKGGAQKSRWPLYLAFSGLGAGSILAYVLWANGTIKPSDPKTPPPLPPPTPPPNPTPTVTSEGQDAGVPSPIDAASSSSADASPPTSKKVELTVDPADAHVFQGTQELEKPLLIEIEPGKKLELEIRREGYKTKKIVLDDSQEKISVHLEKEVKKVPHPPTPKPPPTPNSVPKLARADPRP